MSMIPYEIVVSKIYWIRNQKVMLDRDLAELYGVETKQLKRQVKRNISRFPEDFMFEMTKEELENWRSQFGTSKSDLMGLRHAPYCFTEQGVAMLSSVLNSERAIKVNIEVIRAFTRIRQILTENTELRLAIEKLEKKSDNNTKNIEIVFQYLDELIEKKENQKPRRQIEYKNSRKKL
ncbi:MAG: ORF6N domain-containing protein [Sphingobacteriaceae bacterium]|nr:ORF6N domain-containing protein [Sphingobacteriaceae bacterium]